MTMLRFLFLFILANGINAQDRHFSNYRNTSSFFNTAENGLFKGNIKIYSGLRSQYKQTYEHGVIGAEMNFDSPFGKGQWMSGGFNLDYDKTGDLQLNTKGQGFAVAYHLSLGKKKNTIISLGLALNNHVISADTRKYKSEALILQVNDVDKQLLDGFKEQYLSLGSGLNLNFAFSKLSSMEFGFGLNHLNSPSFRFKGGKNNLTIGRRYNFHTNYRRILNSKIKLEPAIYLSLSERQSNLNLQLFSEIKLKPHQKWYAIAGINHRWGESIDIVAGYGTDQLYLTAAFDIVLGTLGDLFNSKGAVEIGAFYIIRINHTPKLNPLIICPRL